MKTIAIARLAVLSLLLFPLAGCQKEAMAGEKPVSHWIKQLQDPDRTKRHDAANALGQTGPAAKAAVPALTEALKDTDEIVRARAAEALGMIGPDAGSAAPALIEVMKKDSYGTARSWAAGALAGIGMGAKGASVPALMEALTDKDISRSAAAALDKMGEGAAAAERLTKIVNDKTATPEARGNAVMALTYAGDHKPTVSLLVSIVRDETADPEIRKRAALGLGYIGEEAKDAAPALLAALDQKGVSDSAPWSLWRLGETEKAVARLSELVVTARDPEVRRNAASGLVSMAGGNAPPEAKAAVPALIEALKIKDDARLSVVNALGEIGPDAKAAVPALMELLKDDDSFLRDRANDAIKKIAPNP